MYEEGKGGGAQRQRIDLLSLVRSFFFSSSMSRRCLLQQMLVDATFNQCKYYSSNADSKFACVNSFIITFALPPDGYGQMQHPFDDFVTTAVFLYSFPDQYNMYMYIYLFLCASLTMTSSSCCCRKRSF